MATLDGGGTAADETRDTITVSDPQVDGLSEEPLRNLVHDTSSQSSSDSLSPDENESIPDTFICPWRTAQYYDEECSRYHDCPGHVLERHQDEQGREPGREPVESPDAEGEDHRGLSTTDDDSGQRADTFDMPALGTQLNPIVLDASPIASGEALSRMSTPADARTAEPLRAPRSDNTVETAQTPMPDAPSDDSSSILARNARSRPVEIVLSRWQPDSEVTYCPICQTQFSIFVRKHHCRKCGRVVCNSCSPHRITIPYQYIVQPPGYTSVSSSIPQRYPPLPGNEGYVDFNSLGGGERVRLCNPCVPDPNTAPPHTREPSPRGHQRSASNLLSPSAYPGGSGRYGPHGTAPVGDPFARNRSVTMQSVASASSQSSREQYRGPPVFGGTPPPYFSSRSSAHQRQSYAPVPAARYYDGHGRAGPSNVGSSSVMDRSLPPLPQVQPPIAEEDECPVCHRELPRRTLPNFEALREAHINICITTHSAYGSPSLAAANGDGDDGAPLPPIPPRTTRMFPYVATEKDCVDSAECSICLEEFEVGVAMARLECLCRFHRHCIRAWWERHPGRCPMHQHDGYGF